jgi:membrane dipeptidase
MLSRREAILISIAGYLCPLSAPRAAPAAGFSDKQYSNAVVIDALGGPGGFDPSEPDDAPLSPKTLADVRASGVTAVNVTVNEVGNAPGRFERTIAGIARVEHELAAHPDVFLKVLRAKDLADAKS